MSSITRRTATINPYGFDMVVIYEWDEGCPARYSPHDGGDPGWPAMACVLSCFVGSVDIYSMLSEQQIKTIDRSIYRLHE